MRRKYRQKRQEEIRCVSGAETVVHSLDLLTIVSIHPWCHFLQLIQTLTRLTLWSFLECFFSNEYARQLSLGWVAFRISTPNLKWYAMGWKMDREGRKEKQRWWLGGRVPDEPWMCLKPVLRPHRVSGIFIRPGVRRGLGLSFCLQGAHDIGVDG